MDAASDFPTVFKEALCHQFSKRSFSKIVPTLPYEDKALKESLLSLMRIVESASTWQDGQSRLSCIRASFWILQCMHNDWAPSEEEQKMISLVVRMMNMEFDQKRKRLVLKYLTSFLAKRGEYFPLFFAVAVREGYLLSAAILSSAGSPIQFLNGDFVSQILSKEHLGDFQVLSPLLVHFWKVPHALDCLSKLTARSTDVAIAALGAMISLNGPVKNVDANSPVFSSLLSLRQALCAVAKGKNVEHSAPAVEYIRLLNRMIGDPSTIDEILQSTRKELLEKSSQRQMIAKCLDSLGCWLPSNEKSKLTATYADIILKEKQLAVRSAFSETLLSLLDNDSLPFIVETLSKAEGCAALLVNHLSNLALKGYPAENIRLESLGQMKQPNEIIWISFLQALQGRPQFPQQLQALSAADIRSLSDKEKEMFAVILTKLPQNQMTMKYLALLLVQSPISVQLFLLHAFQREKLGVAFDFDAFKAFSDTILSSETSLNPSNAKIASKLLQHMWSFDTEEDSVAKKIVESIIFYHLCADKLNVTWSEIAQQSAIDKSVIDDHLHKWMVRTVSGGQMSQKCVTDSLITAMNYTSSKTFHEFFIKTLSDVGVIRDGSYESGLLGVPDDTLLENPVHKQRIASMQPIIRSMDAEASASALKKKLAEPMSVQEKSIYQTAMAQQLSRKNDLQRRNRSAASLVEILSKSKNNRIFFEMVSVLIGLLEDVYIGTESSAALDRIIRQHSGPFAILDIYGQERQGDALWLLERVPNAYIFCIAYKHILLVSFESGNSEFISLIARFIPDCYIFSDSFAARLINDSLKLVQSDGAFQDVIQDALTSLVENYISTLAPNEGPPLAASTQIVGSIKENLVDHPETCLQLMKMIAPASDKTCSGELWPIVFILMHESNDEKVSLAASELFDHLGCTLPCDFFRHLLPFIKDTRLTGNFSKAVGSAAHQYPYETAAISKILWDTYCKCLEKPRSLQDINVRNANIDDTAHIRTAVAMSLKELANLFSIDDLQLEFKKIVQAINDTNESVAEVMLDAAKKIVDCFGSLNSIILIQVIQEFLPAARSEKAKEFSLLLFGSMARFLPDSDKLEVIKSKLLQALHQSSEKVQISVAKCLMPLFKEDIHTKGIIERYMDSLAGSKQLGDQKAFAYGLAAIVGGVGLSSLTRYGIIDKLSTLSTAKEPHRRSCYLIFLTAFCALLPSKGSPLLIMNFGNILTMTGDSDSSVRTDAEEALDTYLALASVHCCRLFIPIMLQFSDNTNWKIKKSSIDSFGRMAKRFPHLISCHLQQVVQAISNALTDAHHLVRASAKDALYAVGAAIENPETKALVPVILDALCDSSKTDRFLRQFMGMRFAHYCDGPSIALMLPLVLRSQTDRAIDSRLLCIQVLGNLVQLADPSDIQAYKNDISNCLIQLLFDSVAQVRAQSARVLGIVCNDDDGVYQKLENVLETTGNMLERSGAAQGLAEILGKRSTNQKQHMEPIELAQSLEPIIGRIRQMISIPEKSAMFNARLGYLCLLQFLPLVFKSDFSYFIPATIKPVFEGLASENDTVREMSTKIAKFVVKSACVPKTDQDVLGRTATESNDLLSQISDNLVRGLLDENWRVRMSCIQLVIELVSCISDSRAPASPANADDLSGEKASSSKELIGMLGKANHDSILSSLYMLRHDENASVRHEAVSGWKTLVANTPQVLKEAFLALIENIVRMLDASQNSSEATEDDGATANGFADILGAATADDICKKFGTDIIPTFLKAESSRCSGDSMDPSCVSLRYPKGFCAFLCLHTRNLPKGVAFIDQIVSLFEALAIGTDWTKSSRLVQLFDTLSASAGQRTMENSISGICRKVLDFPHVSEEGRAQRVFSSGLVALLKARTLLLGCVIAQLRSSSSRISLDIVCSLLSIPYHLIGKYFRDVLELIFSVLPQQTPSERLEILGKTVEGLSEDSFEHFLSILLSRAADGTANAIVETETLAVLIRMRGPSIIASECFEKVLAVLLSAEASSVMGDTVNDAVRALVAALSKSPSAHLQTRLVFDELAKCQRCSIDSTFIAFTVQTLVASNKEPLRQSAIACLHSLLLSSRPEELQPFTLQIAGPLIRVLSERQSGLLQLCLLTRSTEVLLSKLGGKMKPFVPQLTRVLLKNVLEHTLNVGEPSVTRLGTLRVPDSEWQSLVKLPQADQLIFALESVAESFVLMASLQLRVKQVLDELLQAIPGRPQCVYLLRLLLDRGIFQDIVSSLGEEESARLGNTIQSMKEKSPALSKALAEHFRL